MDATIRVNPLVIRLSNGDSISERHTLAAPPVFEWWQKGGALAAKSYNLPSILALALANPETPTHAESPL